MPNIIDVKLIFTQIPALLAYLPVTLFITVLAMLFGVIVGLGLALIKINRIPVLAQLTALFVSFVRGTPLLVQLYLSYYGVPVLLRYVNYFCHTDFNINSVPSMLFVLVAFSLNEAAYNSETLRAALQSVSKGQIEAAQSLGMTYMQILRRIILPEAFVVALPNLGNNYRYFEAYISLALIYWLLTVIIELCVKFWERKIAIPTSPNIPSYRRGKLL